VKTLAKVMMISDVCVAERIADTFLDGLVFVEVLGPEPDF
jgi:hypothetical protein